MKTAFFDCYSGISGDMCLGAFIDAGVSVKILRDRLATLPLGHWEIKSKKVLRGGISATKAEVTFDSSKHALNRRLGDIVEIIKAGDLPERAVETAVKAFQALARAEGCIHDKPPEEVHFHEIGAVDSIIDITGTALCMCELGIEKAYASAVAVGGGTVETAHGTLPVPAPATARLLEGFRITGGPAPAELATPTGAALLCCLCEPAEAIPDMSLERTGYGAGAADFRGVSNTLRLLIGETTAADTADPAEDRVWMLETNIDDMTGEEMGFLLEEVMRGNALDAFITPIQMKKNRPAFRFTALCRDVDRNGIAARLLRLSSTLGVRYWPASRATLERKSIKVTTRWGEVDVKVALCDGKAVRAKPEFDRCSRIARAEGMALSAVYEAVMDAYRKSVR